MTCGALRPVTPRRARRVRAASRALREAVEPPPGDDAASLRFPVGLAWLSRCACVENADAGSAVTRDTPTRRGYPRDPDRRAIFESSADTRVKSGKEYWDMPKSTRNSGK